MGILPQYWQQFDILLIHVPYCRKISILLFMLQISLFICLFFYRTDSGVNVSKAEIQSYCCNQWRYFESSKDNDYLLLPESHLIFWMILFAFFVISLLEGVIEAYVEWTPYQKLYSFIPEHKDRPVKEVRFSSQRNRSEKVTYAY